MSIRATFHYFQGMECDMYSFYRIPKLLFTSEYFKNLSCEAKVLYGLMLDRMSLSIKNRWFDEEDRAYIFFSVEEIMEMLNCGRNKAVNCLKELDQEKGIGLIEKRRIGLGKTNVIYVKNFSLTEYPDEPAIFDSEETPENVAERKENTETEIEEYDDAIRVRSNTKLTHTNIKTLPYPGFPTDMQPQMAVILSCAEGTSIVTESIWENRFKYVDELSRMGATVKVEGNTAIITGCERLTGAQVAAPDLRAGAALVIAGMMAEGYTYVDDIKFIERGYEDFDEKLRGIGANIIKAECEKDIKLFEFSVS